eukprot:3928315-Pleurochrysis_carterae.AAC.2
MPAASPSAVSSRLCARAVPLSAARLCQPLSPLTPGAEGARRAGASIEQKRAFLPFPPPLGWGSDNVRGVVEIRHVHVRLLRPDDRRGRAPE